MVAYFARGSVAICREFASKVEVPQEQGVGGALSTL